jgi:hypothetical protein
MFNVNKQHQHSTARSTTPCVSSASCRELPIHATAAPVDADRAYSLPAAQPAN